jgi:hypothetical protein
MLQPQATLFSSLAYTTSISDKSLPGDYNFQAATSDLGISFTNLGAFGSQTQRYNSITDVLIRSVGGGYDNSQSLEDYRLSATAKKEELVKS